MNDDDLLVSRLRSLAADAPAPRVDREEVLRRGRRRRVARASGTTLGIGVLCAGLYLGVGGLSAAPDSTLAPASGSTAPATGDESSQDPTSDTPATPPGAVVDEATGTVTLPLDGLTLSRQEHAVISSAREAYLVRCMTDAGFGDTAELVGPVQTPPGNGNAESYGAWKVQTLEATGYERPLPVYPNRIRRGDAAAEEHRLTCFDELRALGIDWDIDRFEQIAPAGSETFAYTDEGQAVLGEWRQCLVDNGVAPPAEASGMIPAEAHGAPLAEQVRIGRIDIACKDDLDVVQRLADVDAAQQREYIERARTYLEERKPIEQAALAASEAYLASQGLSMDDASW